VQAWLACGECGNYRTSSSNVFTEVKKRSALPCRQHETHQERKVNSLYIYIRINQQQKTRHTCSLGYQNRAPIILALALSKAIEPSDAVSSSNEEQLQVSEIIC
jgi:hypothetical protein